MTATSAEPTTPASPIRDALASAAWDAIYDLRARTVGRLPFVVTTRRTLKVNQDNAFELGMETYAAGYRVVSSNPLKVEKAARA